MSKPIFYFILLLSFFIMGCCFRDFKQSKTEESKIEKFINSSGIHPVVFDTIRAYIRKNDVRFDDEPILHYTIWYTQTDTGNLITMWRSSFFPFKLADLSDEHDFYLYEVDKRNVILITRSQQDSLIFDKTVERSRKAMVLSGQKTMNPPYDGSLRIVSFMVIQREKNIYLKPINYKPRFFNEL
ncbi:MAG: hypothetical protein PHR62_13465 [Paludibacter sp.]|nr:hypothetical protein [Paludibacter sp.]